MNERLEHEKITQLLFSLAVPSIFAQIIVLLYNMVDRIYIGRMEDGAYAIAGVGLCASIITIITAVTNLFGRGGSPLASISMGAKNQEESDRIISNSFSSLLVTSIIIMVILLIWGRDILFLFGASENTIGYAMEYLNIYLFGTIFSQLSVGMNYFINCQGYARFGMLTLLLGALVNIVLDPIFIFGFDMGVSGAAFATVLSQFISFLWVMKFLFSKRSVLRIRKEYLMPNWHILRQITGLGFSSFFMNSTEGLLQICFSRQLLFFGGDLAVSGMTVLSSIAQILFLPMEGIAQGSQPILSFNYGAGQLKRVRHTISVTVKVTLMFSLVMVGIMFLFPEVFVGMFTTDEQLRQISISMLRVYIPGYAIMGANAVYQQTYTSLGEGKKAFFFAFYRKIILLIPLIYFLPTVLPFGITAVLLAEPISDTVTVLTNTIHFRRYIRKQIY